MIKIKSHFCWIFFMYFLVHCFANPIIGQETELNFKHLTGASGLSQGVVNSIYRDSKGYMWFATWDGISRYDGIKIKNNDEIAPGLEVSSFMKEIIEDSQGNIWIGSRDALIQYSYRENRFYQYAIQKSDPKNGEVLEFYFPLAANDTLVLINSIDNNRKLIFDKRNKTILKPLVDFNKVQDSIISPVPRLFLPFIDRIAMYSEPFGTLILHVITKSKSGQYYWRPVETSFKSKDEINIIYRTGVLHLVATNYTVYNAPFQFFQYDFKSSKAKIFEIDDQLGAFVKYNNEFYLTSSKNGIIVLDAESFAVKRKIFSRDNIITSLQSSRISALHISDGFLWAGCWGMGISYASLKPPILKRHFQKKEAKAAGSSSFIRGIVEDRRGHFWCNTLTDGIIELDEKFHFLQTLPRTKGPSMATIYLDNNDNLYFGETILNIYHIPTKKRRLIENASYTNFDYRLGNDFEYIIPLAEGKMLMATMRGAYEFNAFSGKFDTLPTNGPFWRGLQEFADRDRHGQIYSFDPFIGLCVLKLKKKLYHKKYVSETSPIPRHFYDQNDSTVWLGTTDGLVKFDSKKLRVVKTFKRREGLPNNMVYAIAPDTFGYLWLSTNVGISRFHPITEEFTNFKSDNNQSENEHNRHAVCTTRDGRILFGSIDGITEVFPWNVGLNQTSVQLQFTGVVSRTAHSPYAHHSPQDALILEKGTSYIEFDFVGIHFENPTGFSLSYKLEGVNETWVKSGNPGNVRFVNLKPGNYRFMIKVNYGSEKQNQNIKSYYFEIPPFWWQTLWARYSAILILILGIIGGIRMYIQSRIRKEKKLLEEQLAIINERERIIADLHDDVGATLSSMKIYSELAQKSATGNGEKTSEFVDKIAQHSKSLMHMMSDIIWSLKSNSEQMLSIKSNILDHFADVLETKEINLHTHLDENLVFKHPNTRKNIVLIIKEALNNIIKYSEAKNAYLTMSKVGKEISLQISDDGKGLDLELVKYGNGLKNIQKRCANIGATCEMKSAPGKGFAIEIQIPVEE